MRVALDTNGLYTTQAGVARYIRGLLHGLQQLEEDAPEWWELAWPVTNFEYRQPQRALKTLYRELIWAHFQAPHEIKRRQTRLLHATATPLVPPSTRFNQVLTLHDLAMLRFPDRFRSWHRRSAVARLRRVHRMNRVICISRFTAQETMELLAVPARKIEVVYNGCDFHPDEPAPTEQKPDWKLPDEFFLFVGSLEPGKNLALLRQTYQTAASQGIRLPPLCVVGVRWEGVSREGRPPETWCYLGRIPDEWLIYLYRRAIGLVFPSKYEGFGLPVAEAMALGCPVICSPVASLPEVGGQAVCMTPPTAQSYLESMRRFLQHPEYREALIRKGRDQIRRFSWKRCAAETAAVYEDAAKQ